MKLLPFPPLAIGVDQYYEAAETIDPEVTPLMLAAGHRNLKLVKNILASGGDVNAHDQRGWTPLIHACMKRPGSAGVVAVLIAAGADVNARDKVGRTALMWAISNHVEESVEVLLAAGADSNARSNNGETPLFVAVNVGDIEITTKLLAAQADPNARAWEEKTPLSIATSAGDAKMVQLLKHWGASR